MACPFDPSHLHMRDTCSMASKKHTNFMGLVLVLL